MIFSYHEPVLLHEVLAALAVKSGGRYIDATIGDGGHTQAILQRGGVVLGIDRDPSAIRTAQDRLSRYQASGRLILVAANFDQIEKLAAGRGWKEADGVLFDLGISLSQLTRSGRGFTFQRDEPLDMRMDPHLSVTGRDLVNGLGRKELYEIFTQFGQVERARAIADALVRARRDRPINTSGELVRIVEEVFPRRGRLHPATKVFMSIRMAVNDELGSLERALPQAARLLSPGGRLVVISFQESEDRIIKRSLRQLTNILPITKTPITPSDKEIAINPRSRSARMRLGEKVNKEFIR